MSTRCTDAVSAAVVALVIWITGRRAGLSISDLLRPTPFFLGAIASVLVEAAFAAWPKRAASLWRQPIVRFGSPFGLLAATVVTGRVRGGSAPFAATLGGLVGYFALLIGISVNLVPEPARWFCQSAPETEPSEPGTRQTAE